MDFLQVKLTPDKYNDLIGPKMVETGTELSQLLASKKKRGLKRLGSAEFDKSMLVDSGLGGPEEMVEAKAERPQLARLPEMKVSNVLDLHCKEYALTFETLPSNFYDCYQTYIYKSCEKCKKSQSKRSFGLCLLCGSLQCVIQCTGHESKSKRTPP